MPISANREAAVSQFRNAADGISKEKGCVETGYWLDIGEGQGRHALIGYRLVNRHAIIAL